MVSDHDPSCIHRTRPIFPMVFPLQKLWLIVIVYILSGDTGESKERFLKCYHFEQLFRVTVYAMVTGGRPHHSEPVSTQWIDKGTKKLFQGTGWYQFLSKFTGENYRVDRKFAESYDGNRVMIGSISSIVDNTFIYEATSLP